MAEESSSCLARKDERDINKIVLKNVKCIEEIMEKLENKIDKIVKRGNGKKALEDLADGVIRRAQNALSLMTTWGPLYTILFMGTHAVKTKHEGLEVALQLISLKDSDDLDKKILDKKIDDLMNTIIEAKDKKINVKGGDITSLSYALYLGFIIKSLYFLGLLKDDRGERNNDKKGTTMLEKLIDELAEGRIPGGLVLRIADIGRRLIDIYLTTFKNQLLSEETQTT